MANFIARMVTILLGLIPWLASMYFLYWLEQSGTWVPETPHRDKITILIVFLGMAASFYFYTFLSSRVVSKQ